MKNYALLLILAATILSCNAPVNYEEASNSITEEKLNERIKALSSDDFLGRRPFTEGETITINYIKDEFIKMGLKPGNGDSYFQEVPMVELTATTSPVVSINGGTVPQELNYWDDYVALTRRVSDSLSITDSELVFAGYGIIAPEYEWDDYKDLDVTGKTVVVLVNDPGFGKEDKTFFKGNEMTYYGRWTYKYEEAARQGAAGILIIHETAHASYPWEVVQGGWTGANLYLQSKDDNMSRCKIEGWITETSAQELFENAGKENYNFYEESLDENFKAFSLGQTISIDLSNQIKKSKSYNVAALYEGTDLKDETIIYSAHWDHFGIGSPVDGDSIYNGAVDNATGVAAILQVAEAFAKLNINTRRSVAFIAVTAEEQGLLGSAHYAENPIYLPNKTVANINVDAIRPIGRVNDFSVIGYGQSELEDYAKRAVEKQNRYITPDPHPEAGAFFRSDHFNFAKIGIPALYAKGAVDSHEHGEEWGQQKYSEYTSDHYHKPSDEYYEGFNSEGVMLDAQVIFDIGFTLANESKFPKWKEGSEFKAIRDR